MRKRLINSGTAALVVLGVGVISTPNVYADSASFASGNGTITNPYIINTASQLQLMAQYVDDGDTDPGTNASYASEYYTLGNNVDLSSIANWTPIGTSDNPFDGTFNGQSYSITGLTIDDSVNAEDGLFGDTEGAIENIIVSGSVTSSNIAGILVGEQDSGSIINSHVSGSVSSEHMVGGLIGFLAGGDIKYSSSTATVNSVSGDQQGGLVGYQNGGDIDESFATGSVTGGLNGAAGGLVGETDSGDISNSYATGSVTSNNYAGGLDGFVDGTITNSYSTGAVSGSGYIGGLFGYLGGSAEGTSFFDTDTSGLSAGIGGGTTTSPNVSGLSDVDMKTTTPYQDASWDTTEWILNVGAYPTLVSYPPSLMADTTNNNTSQAIDITYTDSPAWDSAITEVDVDGTALQPTDYTQTSGKIEIKADILTKGSHTITVKATGYIDATVTQTITAPPSSAPSAPFINTIAFTGDAQIGDTYSDQLIVTGGTMPFTWSITNGSLPTGLSLNDKGEIVGTPTGQAGQYTFTVKVTDANNLSATRQLTLTVDGPTSVPAVSTASIAPDTIGQAYDQSLDATGGSAPYTWSITNGMLPSGLSLNEQTGEITGTPSKGGVYNITVQVKDANGSLATQTIPIDILQSYEREVIWNGQVKNIPAIVSNDGGTQTTYMPIWYVMQLMKSMGVQSTWNGHDWDMNTSSTADLSGIQAGTGSASIYLNGTLVQKVNSQAKVDPSTNQPTTYMPIWYVEQVLNRVGLQSNWNGTTWSVTEQNS